MAKGGTRKNAGRPKGSANKATLEIKAIAREYGPAAIKEAARLAGLTKNGEGKAESETARIAAMNIVLDRAYGKAPQVVDGDGDGGPIKHAVEVTFVGAGKSDKG